MKWLRYQSIITVVIELLHFVLVLPSMLMSITCCSAAFHSIRFFFFATGCSWNTSVSAFIEWNIVPNTFFAPHKLLDYSQFGHHTRYLHVLQLVIIPHFPLFPNDNYYFGSRTPCGFYSVNLMDYVCQFNSSQIFAQTLYAHFTHCDQLGIYFLAAVETNRRFGTRRWWTTGKIKVRFFFFQSKYSKATFLALFIFFSIF